MTPRWMMMLVLATTAAAQSLPEPQFAANIPWLHGYILIRSGQTHYLSCVHQLLVPELELSHPNDQLPSGVEIAYKIAGNTVVITAVVVFGAKADMSDPPDVFTKLLRKPAGTYSARVNESVALAGLAEFGVEPMTIQIVNAQDPNAIHPLASSDAPSIVMEVTGQNRQYFTLALHNNSAQGLTGYSICQDLDARSTICIEANSSASKPLIAAGETLQVHFRPRNSGYQTPSGLYVANPDPTSIVLKGVIFADGAIEGAGVKPIAP